MLSSFPSRCALCLLSCLLSSAPNIKKSSICSLLFQYNAAYILRRNGFGSNKTKSKERTKKQEAQQLKVDRTGLAGTLVCCPLRPPTLLGRCPAANTSRRTEDAREHDRREIEQTLTDKQDPMVSTLLAEGPHGQKVVSLRVSLVSGLLSSIECQGCSKCGGVDAGGERAKTHS